MKDTEKFAISSYEEGFKINSHNSPIMDNQFYSQFREPGQTKKDVSIYYIDLASLLS